ncbi:MAG: sulfite exporter TauE/SafE family protein [Oscillospiraceae bacterium]
MKEILFGGMFALVSGIIGAMGMGGGGVLLIYLSLFQNIGQRTAQGINLAFFIPIGIMSLIIHTKHNLVKWKTAFLLISTGVIGVFCGSYIVSLISNEALGKLFGVFLLLIGIKDIIMTKKLWNSEKSSD